MSDLRNAMHARAEDLESSFHSLEEFDASAAKSAVKRKRVTRATLVSTAAAFGAVVVATGAWAGYGALNTTPAVSPSPTPSEAPAPSATPSQSATPSPSVTLEPEHQIVTGADVGILERLQNPTTGETWHEPEQIDSLELYPDYGDDLYATKYYSVGARGDATIVVAVLGTYDIYSMGYGIRGLFELDDNGVRWIACPSAHEVDGCLDTEEMPPGAALDTSTHYDSLTYPYYTSPATGWTLYTGPTMASYPSTVLIGTANSFPGVELAEYQSDYVTGATEKHLAAFGDSELLEFREDGVIPATQSSRFAIRNPFGAVIWLGAWTGNTYALGGVTWDWYAGDIAWNKGQDSVSPLPATETCFAPDEVVIKSFDESEWQAAGTHPAGPTVYLPIDGGNDLAKATWRWLHDNSWASEIEPQMVYPYETYREFLDARAVFAWQRPDGEWVLAIRSDARQQVYECA